ncbi:hypothetical protein PHYBLDRAFT_170621 [Phycomyces blakesleeanus NRRL 1555(-)]|uniref:Uncharacterized protein n=1 Tax=Phycomyces blakesleeanus (strain ATCC 8743b / DSM 1359 / FGSC 10004 / NBRC 33097 / NRRL 1555) TaxID=763407 RepID=A0A167LWN8_PHYB8|nr:hypothetical protein PHYBLDRAFT_170621 [Phycomyces blakesleeanus NRRL 1555(-)]OAD71244.1 hypothetical protein PHYBLDRAFT_170621 [Phycomyces blakesleeanus NRRL 1555(-)]|eukprot:XP_018289284.1 hypothetical protein PHYBLDRAFT_170621 [Phycomyces blakesleeanus NRRL 1555(-)]
MQSRCRLSCGSLHLLLITVCIYSKVVVATLWFSKSFGLVETFLSSTPQGYDRVLGFLVFPILFGRYWSLLFRCLDFGCLCFWMLFSGNRHPCIWTLFACVTGAARRPLTAVKLGVFSRVFNYCSHAFDCHISGLYPSIGLVAAHRHLTVACIWISLSVFLAFVLKRMSAVLLQYLCLWIVLSINRIWSTLVALGVLEKHYSSFCVSLVPSSEFRRADRHISSSLGVILLTFKWISRSTIGSP